MKGIPWVLDKVKRHGTRILVIIATYSLYYFLFNDYFEVDPYGETAIYYAICATFLTFYIWKRNQITK